MKTILAALNAKFVHSNLAIRYIKAYCSTIDIEIFETSINENYMETAMSIIDKKPDIIGFSCYIWNIEGTLKISSIIKEILPNTIILFGGPEVTYNGREYLEKYSYVDYVIKGEGEQIFKNFIDKVYCGEIDFEVIDGLIFRRENMIIENKASTPIEILDNIPFPYQNETPERIVYYEASRGCPFNCSYCLSGGDGGVRFFSIERVKKDLKQLIEGKVELVKFVDRTFNANKKFAIEIWKFLMDNAGATKFHFEIGADILTDEMLGILEGAPKGLFQFEIGVQSTNLEILKNIDRIMDFNKVKENIIRIRKSGNIPCHIDLIAGLPGEDMDSFIRSFEDCMEMKPEVLQLGFLKVLKGSRIFYEKEKYGIHYMAHPNYHVLYTQHMNYENIRQLLKFEKVFEIYYNSGIFKITMEYMLSKQKSIFTFLEDFTDFLEKKDFFIRKIDLRDRFKLLYEYAILCFDESIIKDIMIHDFIINTKKSVLPEFLKKEIEKHTKEVIYENKDKLVEEFNEFDIKKLFVMPVGIKIVRVLEEMTIEKCSAIVVFHLVSGKYCYIN